MKDVDVDVVLIKNKLQQGVGVKEEVKQRRLALMEME